MAAKRGMAGAPAKKKDEPKPDQPGIAYGKMVEAVTIVRDIWRGTVHVRACGERYLPRYPREALRDYTSRLKTAVLFNALARTVRGLAGMVMRKDPQLGDDVPQTVKDSWEDIDQAGRHGAVFTHDVLEAAVLDGHTGIFVDMPRVDPGAVKTLADQKALVGRPYWTHVLKEDILRWRVEKRKGQHVLVGVAFRERVTKADGEFSEREVECIREYARDEKDAVTFRVWEREDDGDDDDEEASWAIVDDGTLAIPEIPLAIVYAKRTDVMMSEPPLFDLAMENIAHYQLRSDYQHALHIAGIPVPVFKGLAKGDTVPVSVDHGISLPATGDVKYLEPVGASLDASRMELAEIEKRMAALGLAMLQRDTRAAETAEAKRIDKQEQDSALSVIARGLQDGLEAAARFHAMWLGVKGKNNEIDGGSIEVNDDFGDVVFDPQTYQLIASLVDKDYLSIDTLWMVLQDGGILPDGFDTEAERLKIEKQASRLVPTQLQAFAGRNAPPALLPAPKPGAPPALPPGEKPPTTINPAPPTTPAIPGAPTPRGD